MSLKAFHLAFISVSTIMAFGFGVWTLMEDNGNYIFYGFLSFIAGVGLIIYGIRFLKKFREVSYL